MFKKSIQILLLVIVGTATVFAQEPSKKQDTIQEIKTAVKDTLAFDENAEKLQDSTATDSIPKKKPFLDGDVSYSAKDYMRLNRKNGKMYLYDDAKIEYTDLDIESGSIIVHQSKKEVYAKGIVDTANVYTQTPIFTQGSNVVEPDTIRFNFASKKALIYNSKTSQQGFNIVNEVSKRENDSVVYMKNVKFTTSQNLEDPEYYFYARRIKFVPQKKIITGLVNMYIADVPTPLGLPFGYFPMKQEAVSGFIIPSFNQSDQQGFQFQNGGYYFAISEKMNLTVVGDYSTNSSYALRMDSDYARRYKFSGNFSARFESNIIGERGFPNFSENSNYNIRWSHRRASKANPNSNFSANVNFGSSQFFRQSRNQTNIGSQLTNTLSSNISYSKAIPIEPRVDFQTALSIRQNSNTERVNVNTPTSINMGRIFPFAPKGGVKKGIIQNINFQARTQITNQIETAEDSLFTKESLRNARQGIRTSIPISTNFKILKYLSASASTSFTENWVFETTEQSYDENGGEDGTGEVVRDKIKGFDAFRTYNFSTSVGTTVYGTVQFKKEAKIKAIRHVIRPSVSYSYTPAFDQFYDSYTIPASEGSSQPDRVVEYTRFQGGVLGAPGNREVSSMSISLNNTLEAKVADRDTTKLEPKIVKIFNSLNFSTSYNFKADSLKLRPVAVSGSIPVVKKVTINFGATLDPYALNNNNRRINTLNINNGGSLFRLTRANMNFGYSFSSKDINKLTADRKKDQDDLLGNETFRNGGRQDDLFGSHTNLNNGKLFDEDTEEEKADKLNQKFYNFKIPWSLRLSYAVNYDNAARRDEISSHSINFSGDVELAPRWKIGASSGYDVKNQEFTYTNLRFQRDLESWNMSFNWVPFSAISSWNFFIGISSAVLSDIKWDKRRQPDRTVN